MPITFLLGIAGVAASFTQRLLDPLTLLVANGLAVDPDLVVLLAPALALPLALGQPFLGPLGDAWGKVLIVKLCVVLLVISGVGAAIAPNYSVLFAMRMLTGVAAGGIIPASIALIADRYPIQHRQVAMSRFMTMMMVGQMFTGPVSAIMAEATNWRTVLGVAGGLSALALAVVQLTLPTESAAARKPLSVSGSLRTYRALLSDSRARICYATVFMEGVFLFGYTPHVALYLQSTGFGGAREAGYVLAASGFGGIVFAMLVGPLTRRFSRHAIMRAGATCIALGHGFIPLAPGWPALMLGTGLLGFGFYLLHSGLQIEVTEIMPSARASAVSLHAGFMFIGMAIGPVVFGLMQDLMNWRGAFWVCAGLLLLAGITASLMLERRARASLK